MAHYLGPKKTMTARDVPGFFVFSSARKLGRQVSSHFGAMPSKLHCEPGKKGEKHPLGKTQKTYSGDGAPRMHKFLSLVVVERILNCSGIHKSFFRGFSFGVISFLEICCTESGPRS